ncbi:hypothetical protein ENSA5_33220 [Enhygromyxa salina]|uniref:N-acetyltransferase domain-containing protein n=2 Tax=Enhygromyxa salina TaxID=215803 RepID=A0A2S9XXD0_9BACT|nr:hypothetical protein ENSA5_33220 [Enhygromyxa salina]
MERVLLDSVAREPDSEVIEGPDWMQVRTPSSLRPNHNKVIVARLPSREADDAVAAVAAEHASRGASHSWFVGPSSAPADLGKRLVDHGYSLMGPSLGMAREIGDEDLSMHIPGMTLRQVRTEVDIQDFASASATAWERGPQFRDTIADITRKALAKRAPTRSWIASLGGEIVATTHLRFLPDCGYLQGCAVVPARRREGIYRALVNHRLAVLRDAGLRVAVIFAAANTSGQGCKALGFSTICEGEFYEKTV